MLSLRNETPTRVDKIIGRLLFHMLECRRMFHVSHHKGED